MKTLTIIFLLLSLYACTSKEANGQPAEIPYRKTFYWINSTSTEFHAMSFEKHTKVFCDIYSFGEKEKNTRVRYEVMPTNTEIIIKDSSSGVEKGSIILESDSTCLLTLTGENEVILRMAANSSFGQLFNEVKTIYLFECIGSNQVLYNGVECFKTPAEYFFNDPSYKRIVETYKDEIYGSGEFKYLLYHNNKLFYTSFMGKTVFNKIEINSNIRNPFQGIVIGDTKSEVQKKLNVYLDLANIGDLSISVKICNSQVPGYFGRLWFYFKTSESAKDVILHKIVYDALLEE